MDGNTKPSTCSSIPPLRVRFDRRHQGVALVIVLAFVVLLTGLIVAFFSQAVTERQVSNSNVNDSQADTLARSAVDSVVGDLKQEIVKGSTTFTAATGPTPSSVYEPASTPATVSVPLTATGPATAISTYMVPARYGNPYYAGGATSDPIPNLVRTSAYITSATPAPMVVSGAASNVSTTAASANNRSIKPARWNEHYLIPMPAPAGTPNLDSSPIASFTAPSWVFVTPAGPAGIITAPSSSISGRYAYAIYNVGGLLDVDAAGYPSILPTSTPHASPTPTGFTDVGYARKGSIAFADLTQLPSGAASPSPAATVSPSQVDNLIGWRNYVSAQASGNLAQGYTINSTGAAAYFDVVTAASVGFLSVPTPTPGAATTPTRTDQMFPDRQSLIKYTLATGMGQSVLQYLTTFNKVVNAPCWEPRLDAGSMGGSPVGADITTGSATRMTYNYLSNKDLSANPGYSSQLVYNSRLLNVRVMHAFTRLDGTQAVVGEPLIKNRFDLNRLAWLAYPGEPDASAGGVAPQYAALGVTATDIYHYFGLTRITGTTPYNGVSEAGGWSYNHTSTNVPSGTSFPAVPPFGSASTILTLQQVANLPAGQGREPDFFELLQAGILQGSLGMCSGDPTQQSSVLVGGEFYRALPNAIPQPLPPIVRTDVNGYVDYAQEKYQIIQIGANIIAQAHTDGYPPEITLNGEHFYGIENLPYINGTADTAIRAAVSGTTLPASLTTNSEFVHHYLVPALWNPHQNALKPPSAQTPSLPGPTTLRFYCNQGYMIPYLFNLSAPANSTSPVYANDFAANPEWVTFPAITLTTNFAEPAFIPYATATGNMPVPPAQSGLFQGAYADANGNKFQRVGVYIGYNDAPDSAQRCAPCAPCNVNNTGGTPAKYSPITRPFNVYLQYLGADSAWHNYEEVRGLVDTRDGRGDPFMEPNDPNWQTSSASANPHAIAQAAWPECMLDPRTPRYSMESTYALTVAQSFYSMKDDPAMSFLGPHVTGVASGATTVNTAVNYWNNWGAGNLSISMTEPPAIGGSVISYLTDRDSVCRLADASGWTGADPQMPNMPANRPLMLNRPFRSVGELGYVFRDDPWKTLNLMSPAPVNSSIASKTPTSADSALLDIFCIGQAPATSTSALEVVGGKVNINSAPVPVLQAILAGTARTFSTDQTAVVTSVAASDSQTMATNIVQAVQASSSTSVPQPLYSIAELPGLFPQAASSPPPTSTAYPPNKAQREAMVRALADVSDTRTWNLLIDVIAQSGRYPTNATTLSQFVVTGEKHYWLHVAIDRYTGSVVGRQLEPVAE